MDINPFLDQIVQWLSAVNPWLAAAAAALVFLIRTGRIKLPFTIPMVTPPADPVRPLLDRLKALVGERFSDLNAAGHDPDDTYKHLLDQLWVDPVKPEPKK